MAKVKAKEEATEKAGGVRKAAVQNAETPSEALQFWKEEIVALKNQRFSSIEEATSAIVDRVLQRLNLPGAPEETRAFLLTLIETDPEMQDWIREGLQVG